MITVIVCSVRPSDLEQFKINLQDTIGVEYQLLIHDNRVAKRGLCSVYNELAGMAAYGILCFAHEDILFKTNSWGRKIEESLQSEFSVVGVAGSKYKSGFFSGWYTGNKEFDCANILHRLPEKDEKIHLNPSNNSTLEEVVCLDGVFVCCKKAVWQNVLFDEVNLKAFHFYDIDFSLRCSERYRVAVSYEIDIMHITRGGDFGDRWIEVAIDYHDKTKISLPVTKLKKASHHTEIEIAKTTLDMLKSQKISVGNKLRWIKTQRLYKYSALYYSMLKFLFYKPLGLKAIHNLFK